MKYTRYCRSMLSTPALQTDRFRKSHEADADICMVDLEDSIPPWDKDTARNLAARFFVPPAPARCAIRINTLTTPDGLRDLLAIRDYPTKPAIVVVPMVESPRDIEVAESVLVRTCPDVEFLAVVETPRGVENANAIAAASPRLRALIFGSADYSFLAGVRLAWDTLVHARARLVNAARAAGIEVIDAPTFEISEHATIKEDAVRAHDLGFSGKIAIHPRQVPVINEAFSPDTATLEKARRIVAAGQENGRKIAVVDGAMVGIPFFEASQHLIEEFGDLLHS
ncbi:HpcH/HpaI aldolase/citrate lyase family protein [Amycolatopsis aidingensis]|uniref:HpcH/HpaI aldolase/citrate lyase family protein n=1 Tax=Amycolatopsis aidingensis TaxID=2842453 RepID=UPI001C0D7F04|nr:CoA ester lyase [Amycolatopsis aidingensis]